MMMLLFSLFHCFLCWIVFWVCVRILRTPCFVSVNPARPFEVLSLYIDFLVGYVFICLHRQNVLGPLVTTVMSSINANPKTANKTCLYMAGSYQMSSFLISWATAFKLLMCGHLDKLSYLYIDSKLIYCKIVC